MRKRKLQLIVSKGRTSPRIVSAAALTREVTRRRVERLQKLEDAIRAHLAARPAPASPAPSREKPKPLAMPTVFADVDIANGELPVVSWPTYKRRVRAYLERIARRR